MNSAKYKKNQKELKKQLILDAASSLFAQKGYFATTISDIAKMANISFGSVAYHYQNKEQLFEAVVLAPFKELEEMFSIVNSIHGSSVKKISAMVNLQINSLVTQSTSIRLVQYVIGQKELFPVLMEKIIAFWNELREIITPTIEEGQRNGELEIIDPKVVFASYFSFLSGVILTVLDEPSHPVWQEFVVQGIRLFGPKEPYLKDIIDTL
jgi:AcrR family transcriptional regulator